MVEHQRAMPFLSVVYVSEESDGEREGWQRVPGGGKHITKELRHNTLGSAQRRPLLSD